VLASLPTLTPRRLHRLAWRVGSASSCLAAVRARRWGSAGDAECANRLHPEDIRRRLDRLHLRTVVPGSADYIDALEDLPDPPAALFVRGRELPALDPAVAIVGARRCSALGAEVARSLGSHLAASGICVVSGAARGIDRASHEGALAAPGPTIAVLGCGVDRVSSDTLRLLRRIEDDGAVVTEYPPGVGAAPRTFPARNRLVAALARGIVIVEGGERSGTLITTDHALSMGREVFAVPGPITNPLSDVPNALIREGATLVRGADDILVELGLAGSVDGAPEPSLEGDEQAVYALVTTAVLAETLSATTRFSTARVSAALTTLEMKGLVRCVGGRYERRYRR
jgi:DNA processing protein